MQEMRHILNGFFFVSVKVLNSYDRIEKKGTSGMKKAGKILLALAALVFCLCLAGCGESYLEYKITVTGEATDSGTITFLDYSINVYQDLASNPCGDCEDQPVHLYVGADAEETAQAISDAIERADDLWEVVSCEDGVVVLREKTAGSVEEIPSVTAPEGLTLTASVSGREVTLLAGENDSDADADEDVEYPEDPQRLAAVYGPSYELLTMLGVEDKIVVRADVQTADFPWAEQVFSRISEIPMLNNVHTSVNFEELMTYDPDIVYTFPRENELTQLKKAGVAALAGETSETLDGVKEQVRNYAATLGEDAEARAEEYCTYFDEKLAMVREITDAIPDEEKPTVYYAGVDILTTYGKYSDLIEVIEAAGGIAVSADLEAGNRSQINYEQLMSWNPDVIFIDHGGMNDGETVEELKEEIMSNTVYASLTAVQNGEIYLSPSGVFYWDMGIQKILLVMYMAQTLHPDEFADLDMEQEVMTFYQTFFGYDLTRDEAYRILNRLSPE
ncbi:MAG: ABC transporter substrate-binding protein [Clostridiales bacterium]|nr:ABC transporter substrate-binding protein [Clostridiales bacterium]